MRSSSSIFLLISPRLGLQLFHSLETLEKNRPDLFNCSFVMRTSLRLFAAPATPPFRPGQRAPALALLPPIPLYRRLLRIHRKKLTTEERIFGDTYLKAEFRRHRDIENPLHIVGFLTEWQQYGQQLEGDDWKGQKIDTSLLDKLSDQQVGQMYELMQAIQKRGRDSVDEEEEGRILEAIEAASDGTKKES